MTVAIVLQILLFGIALSMDAFAVSVTDGLIYTDIDKKKSVFIATVFGVMQALMPLIGYWLVHIVTILVGESGGQEAGHIMSTIVTWVAFALLLFIGGKMLIEAIIDIRKPAEQKEPKKFSYKEVLIMGIATAIDALAVGVSLHTGEFMPNGEIHWIWMYVSIIMVCTFIISLLGVFFGNLFEKLFKGKYEVCSIIGGAILITLAVWIVVSHYTGI